MQESDIYFLESDYVLIWNQTIYFLELDLYIFPHIKHVQILEAKV